MRPVLIAIGAFALVLGGALIAFAPFYVTTGFYRSELQSVQSFNSSANPSTMLSTYSGYADTGEIIALIGALVAPVGAAILAFGLTKGKSEEKKAVTTPEPTQT